MPGGKQKTVSALFNEHLNANRKEKDPSDRKVVLMFLVPIALIVAAFLFAQNAYQVALVPWWGVGASLKALGAITVLLLANIYLNPKNPLKRFQMPEVAQPTLVELEFAAEACNQLRAAFPEDGHASLK